MRWIWSKPQRVGQNGKMPEVFNVHTEQDERERKLKVAAHQVMAVAQQLAVSLDEYHAFSGNLYESAKKMAHINRDAESQLQQMFEEFQTTVERLANIRSLSNEMESTGIRSGSTMRVNMDEIVGIVSDIHHIDQSTQETMEMVSELSQLSGAITKILDTVADISAETQLLAFNASIESARAGAAGAGFAVVADRIKKLSDDSRNSVKDIRRLVNQILAANQQVREKMEETAGKVHLSVIRFQKVEEGLSNIHDSFGELVNKSHTIISAVNNEENQALQLQRQVESVREQSRLSLAQVEDVYQSLKGQRISIDELSDLGLRLNQAASTLQPMIINEPDLIGLNEMIQSKARDMVKTLQTEADWLKGLMELTRDQCSSFVKRLLESYPILEAAWVNDPKGRFVVSVPEAGIANARVREWFVNSVQGNDFVTTPYISAITGKPCVTVSVPVYGNSGDIKGVLGVDFQC